jgi:hypothetical protein
MNIDLEGMRVFGELANRGSSGEASGAPAQSRARCYRHGAVVSTASCGGIASPCRRRPAGCRANPTRMRSCGVAASLRPGGPGAQLAPRNDMNQIEDNQ